MPMHCDAVTSTGAGGTADTFNNVGTVTLRSNATRTLGIWVIAPPVTATAAEGIHGQVRVTSSDLGVGAQIYGVGPYLGGAPGTNIDFRVHNAEFVPFVHDAKGKENVEIDYSTHVPDPTATNAIVAGLVYMAGEKTPPPDLMERFPYMAPIAGGADSEAAETITTVAETAITDLNVPAWASQLVGLKQVMVPDLMTAGEEVAGFVRYRSSIPDFEPQEWPFAAGIGAPLGTPVGAGAQIQTAEAMGWYFPSTGKNETITPNVVLVAAITTGHGAQATVYFR